MIYNTPLMYGKGWNKKTNIGKCGQKEPLIFYGQVNWFIFYTFHNKNGFIYWVDYHFM